MITIDLYMEILTFKQNKVDFEAVQEFLKESGWFSWLYISHMVIPSSLSPTPILLYIALPMRKLLVCLIASIKYRYKCRH